ncbi:MAG: CPBP family intramembrane metalloprotease [Verrucomicrobia bacterium]|nr:CPBP family intramembrane metalloprotease [Verrucomicrobiota bacterium]
MPDSPDLPTLLRARVTRALKGWPDPAGWRASGIAFGFFALYALAVGFVTGFFQPQPTSMPPLNFLGLILILFVFPGIAEEMVFRGLLLPHPAEPGFSSSRVFALVLSSVIFILWHVGNAWLTFPSARPVFWDWRFLLIVAGLGLTCGWSYQRTGSIWPPVILHWFIVVIWKACLGGPVFFK